jgi:N-acetylmuramoyl-L-alanine amidase
VRYRLGAKPSGGYSKGVGRRFLPRGIGWVPLLFFLSAAVCAAVLAVWTFADSRDGSPSFARLLLQAALFPRLAAHIAAGEPDYLTPPPFGADRRLLGPWRIGIQAGHVNIDQLPDELWRLRTDSGASYRGMREVDVNLQIARRVARDLVRAGVVVDLLPATVPPGYEADAFVAIHADGGGQRERGFKVSAPWRASEASRLLAEAIERTYGVLSGIPEDRYGVTYNMRGYYAFSWYRFEHAVAPTTQCAIIETGYLTSAADRRIIVDDPEASAQAISDGIIQFLGERPGLSPGSLVARAYTPMIVSADRAALRFFPDKKERISAVLPWGTVVRPICVANDWVELIVWGNFRIFGWMRRADLQPAVGG